MSLGEILWRVKSLVRDSIDRYRFQFNMYPSRSRFFQSAHPADGFGFRTSGASNAGDASAIPAEWKQALIRQADRISAHRFSFFDLDDVFLGDPIDWNRDHAHAIQAPLGYSQSIDYRDFRVTGDCKLVWEPNRHHHLVVLGRAFCATGDRRYAIEAVAQIQSWMGQCPFGKGMNWRSPLELGIRLINWVWVVDLIRESGLIEGEFRSRLMHCVYLHLWEITRKYSKGSSANNHLVGEAAGVFVASSFFPDMPNASKWRDESSHLLTREILAQTYSDGCTREQAFGYHLFTLQLFLVAAVVGRSTGREFQQSYWSRMEKMFAFAAAMLEGGGNVPLFGDCDDGYALDLGGRSNELRSWLGVAAILFNRSDFKTMSGGFPETAHWLLGAQSRQAFDSIPTAPVTHIGSREFPDSGYYLLQCGAERRGRPAVSVVFDCGELGYTSIAAHGHADALSFTLRVDGHDVFVDPGAYDYFTHPAWRSYFRSTWAHNTVVVDHVDQSVMVGPFMWGQRAESRCLTWQPDPQGGGRIVAEHDGYSRLEDPVIHRRSLELSPDTRRLTIEDVLTATSAHSLAIVFHCSEQCGVQKKDSHTLSIALSQFTLVMELDERLDVAVITGSQHPIRGWTSRGYHRKAMAATIVAQGRVSGSSAFVTTLRFYPLDKDESRQVGVASIPKEAYEKTT
jgi:hypothetical protein